MHSDETFSEQVFRNYPHVDFFAPTGQSAGNVIIFNPSMIKKSNQIFDKFPYLKVIKVFLTIKRNGDLKYVPTKVKIEFSDFFDLKLENHCFHLPPNYYSCYQELYCQTLVLNLFKNYGNKNNITPISNTEDFTVFIGKEDIISEMRKKIQEVLSSEVWSHLKKLRIEAFPLYEATYKLKNEYNINLKFIND